MAVHQFYVKKLSWLTFETADIRWLRGRDIGPGFFPQGSARAVMTVEVLEGIDPFCDFIEADGENDKRRIRMAMRNAALDTAVHLWRSGRSP